MKTYLVGGAVRDELLGYPVGERDWVVVGAAPEALLARGFTRIGKDFPVFLHPETKEQYALARTERKRGRGHTGFEVHAAATVTLEEDLRRRDLTVNAMARGEDGAIIDPCGGRRDLEAKVLRHVSPAFAEDPLRVLRAARFAARYAHRGFTLERETLALMEHIVKAGELATLPAERVWAEMRRALGERDPRVFVEVLRDCAALKALLPEVDALFGVPQTARYHPEIDTGLHTLLTVQQAARLTGADGVVDNFADSRVVFAALVHDLGKGVTAPGLLPAHRGHEQAGLPLVEALCERLKVPRAYRDLALTVCAHHLNCHRARELRAATLLRLLTASGALRDGDRFEGFLRACTADARGRAGCHDAPYPQADYLRRARDLARSVTAFDAAPACLPAAGRQQAGRPAGTQGRAIGEALRRERIRRLHRHREASKARGPGGAVR